MGPLHCYSKVSKILTQNKRKCNFKKFLICLLLKVLTKETLCASYNLYFLIGNLTQNVYNGKFSNVYHSFILYILPIWLKFGDGEELF